MNFYVNLSKPHDDNTENIFLEVPSGVSDSILDYCRYIQQEKNMSSRDALKCLFYESVKIIEEQYNVRKNRKTKKW